MNSKPIRAIKKTSDHTISKLTYSALAIPALVQPSILNAAVAPQEHSVNVRLSQYKEIEMPSERVAFGSLERYAIEILQFTLVAPLKNDKALNTYVAYETMSGASPLTSRLNDSGQTVVTMSGASIEEKRVDANIALTKYTKRSTLTGAIAISNENDYQSVALSLDGSIENNNKHLTLLGSLSVSVDELSPTNPGLNTNKLNALGESKHSFSGYFGFNRILNQYSTLQVGVGLTQISGYLSDPYRITDIRPDVRNQTTLNMQYRTFSSSMNSAVHFNYRYYQDDWDILAHTLEASIWKDISFSSFSLLLSPNVRYYWQHQAKFYDLDAASTNAYRSSDFRLSAYGSINIGVDLKINFTDTAFTLGANQYFSSENFGLTGAQDYETPSLVNFSVMSFGMEYRF